MNTNFKVNGLTRPRIKPKSTAPEADAPTTGACVGVADHLSTTPRWEILLPFSAFSDATNNEIGDLFFTLLHLERQADEL